MRAVAIDVPDLDVPDLDVEPRVLLAVVDPAVHRQAEVRVRCRCSA